MWSCEQRRTDIGTIYRTVTGSIVVDDTIVYTIYSAFRNFLHDAFYVAIR